MKSTLLGHYDEIRRSADDPPRSGNVDVVFDASAGRDVGICHLVGLQGFTSSASGDGTPQPYEYTYPQAASAQLAAHHFNTGDGSVVPALEGINERCPVRFTLEFGDTGLSEFEAVRMLTDIVTRDRGRPCAILGATRSASTGPTSILSSVHGYPQMSWWSASSELSDRSQRPLFSRVIISTDDIAKAAVRYLREELEYDHCAVLFVNDNFGSATQRAFLKLAEHSGLHTTSVPFSNNPTSGDAKEAIATAKATEYRCMFGIWTTTEQHDRLLEEAYHQDIVGPEYFWLIGNDPFVSSTGYEKGSPLDVASQGIGNLQMSPGRQGQRGFDAFQAAWAGLSEEEFDYLESNFPETPYSLSDFVQPGESMSTGFFAYDTVAAMGLAACNATLSRGGDNGTYFTGEELAEAIVHGSMFEGASGVVKIDPDTISRLSTSVEFLVTNLQRRSGSVNGSSTFDIVNSAAFVPNTDGSDWNLEVISPFVYADGTVRRPDDLPPLNGGKGEDMNFIGGLVILGYMLCSLAIAASLAFATWTYLKRRERAVRASQPLFLFMILAGTTILASAIIPMSVDDQHFSQRGCDIACMSVPWLVSIGFATCFSALFSKTWRVNRIIRESASFGRVKVEAKDVMAPFAILLGANLIVLICWTILSPLVFVRVNRVGTDTFNRVIESYGSCTSETTTNGGATPYAVLLVIINFFALMLANIQAYIARAVETDYSESKYVAMSMVCILEISIVALPLVILVEKNPQAEYILRVLLVFVTSISVSSLMFIPKIFYVRELKVEKERRRKEKAVRLKRSAAAMAQADQIMANLPETPSVSQDEERGLGVYVKNVLARTAGGRLPNIVEHPPAMGKAQPLEQPSLENQ